MAACRRPSCAAQPALPAPGPRRSIANIVTQYGFGDGQVWMANWEAAWQANLDACGPDGKCTIH